MALNSQCSPVHPCRHTQAPERSRYALSTQTVQSTDYGPTQFLHLPEQEPRHISHEDPVQKDKQEQDPSKSSLALEVHMTQLAEVGPTQFLHLASQVPM